MADIDMVRPGARIKGAFWSEPVEIKLIEEAGNYIHIVGAKTLSREYLDQLISREDFEQCSLIGSDMSCSESPWKVFLALETIRYRFSSLYDHLLAMNTSKVEPLPHQIEAVYGYALKLPRIRFLIADDPGAGKTVMAGLIIKELKFRNLARRILIVAPGHLKDQWRRELAERFEEKFMVTDRGLLDAFYGENVWLRENQLITSLDFAKREDVLPSLSAARFDLIIVDEAHKMSAYRYGEKITKTGRYKLGAVLSKITEHLLFLTATPHKGDTDNFRLFLDLLEPGFFATNKLIQDSVVSKDNPLFIRRLKEDMKDFDGKPLFLPRHVETVPFRWKSGSPDETDLYNDLSKYVEHQYNKALTKDKKRNVAFALVILQRRLASSTYALLKSLQRRKKRLEELLSEAQGKRDIPESISDMDSVEDLSEDERWKEEEIWETLSVAENRDELEREIRTIEKLIAQSEHIIRNEIEVKLREFKAGLENLRQKFTETNDKKILVFTESRDTLEYLEDKIRSWNYKVNTIHGGMKLEERVRAEKIFKNESDIMVATEAAGEGINLQFCHLMINYDIPWNPNRLEQRMGRIHRYGQQKEVYVFNLVAVDTREGEVLDALFRKLDEIRRGMGSDKVFDVLNEVLSDKNLSQLLTEAAANARNIGDILKDIEITVDDEYIAEIREHLGESLATRYIDYTGIREMADRAREYRLIPEYTESFFRKAFERAGGKVRELPQGFLSVESVPYELRKIAAEDSLKKSFGELLKKYAKVTFDKQTAFKTPDAEFITFGHPLFESLMVWIESNFSESLLNGATFDDPDGKLNGHILFYEGEIKDGKGETAGKRLFCIYVNADKNTASPVSPAIIWDLKEAEDTNGSPADIESLNSISFGAIIPELEAYKAELLHERIRQSKIKEKYGVKSLEYLILELDGDLISLFARKEQGENVDLAVRNKDERKNAYERALADLKIRIRQEQSLSMSMPEFTGIIRVNPSRDAGKMTESDERIEQIGMDIAMRYERAEGRQPEDVSGENLGFDIRSKDIIKGQNRYIEVKARSESGAVALTQNEWFKARQFKDAYYLYAVMDAATAEPRLYRIQNPAENLKPEETFESVRYVVPLTEIKTKGESSIETGYPLY